MTPQDFKALLQEFEDLIEILERIAKALEKMANLPKPESEKPIEPVSPSDPPGTNVGSGG